MTQPAMAKSGREYPKRPLVGIGVALLRRGEAGPELLLVRRARPPALGQWSLPGGAQHVGETAEAAARRELHEETGLEAGALVLAGYVDSIHLDADGRVQYHYTILDFAGLWQGGDPVAADDVSDVHWANEAEFEDLSLWSEARRIFQAAQTLLMPPQ